MEQNEELKRLLGEMADNFSVLMDEYEQRISDYETALEGVNELLQDLEENNEGTETDAPDALMSDLLLEQEELQDTLPQGFTGSESRETLQTALNSLQRLQDMNDQLSESMNNTAFSGMKDGYLMCRDLLETALTETKADYMRLLRNITLMGSIGSILNLENEPEVTAEQMEGIPVLPQIAAMFQPEQPA